MREPGDHREHVEELCAALRTERLAHEETKRLLAASPEPFRSRCADAVADEVATLVRRHVIDSRSPAANALLDYRNPPSSPRAERLAEQDDVQMGAALLRVALDENLVVCSRCNDVGYFDVEGEEREQCVKCVSRDYRTRAAQGTIAGRDALIYLKAIEAWVAHVRYERWGERKTGVPSNEDCKECAVLITAMDAAGDVVGRRVEMR